MSVTASCPVAMPTGLVASNTTYVLYPEVNEVYGFGVQRHFQQYVSYIVAVSFIGGGNQSTRTKPSTCRKSLTHFIT